MKNYFADYLKKSKSDFHKSLNIASTIHAVNDILFLHTDVELYCETSSRYAGATLLPKAKYLARTIYKLHAAHESATRELSCVVITDLTGEYIGDYSANCSLIALNDPNHFGAYKNNRIAVHPKTVLLFHEVVQSYENGWLAGKPEIDTTLIHEFGHHVFACLHEATKGAFSEDIIAYYNMLPKKRISEDVSLYAAKNVREFFAEAFTDVWYYGAAHQISRGAYKIMRQHCINKKPAPKRRLTVLAWKSKIYTHAATIAKNLKKVFIHTGN